MSAVALAPKVRVNGISPGFIFNLEGNNKEEELRAVKSGRILTEKLPEVANILQALDFFLANTAITGQILAIDAGSGLL
jgi:NAD(P)-dependent dehydrogenase (short-subunit alcohol dehydrogenase family)